MKSNITKLYRNGSSKLIRLLVCCCCCCCCWREKYSRSNYLFFSLSFCTYTHNTLHMYLGRTNKKWIRILFFYLQWCGFYPIIHWRIVSIVFEYKFCFRQNTDRLKCFCDNLFYIHFIIREFFFIDAYFKKSSTTTWLWWSKGIFQKKKCDWLNLFSLLCLP